MAPRVQTTTAIAEARVEESVVERRLPSGRSLVVRVDGAGEEIEIRDARGEMDVRITLTDAGPVIAVRGARLELDSPDVAVRCRTFDVHATEALTLSSDREVRIQADEVRAETKQDIHLNGAFIRLNCTADAEPPEAIFARMAALAAAAGVPASSDHDHDHAPAAANDSPARAP
jgi:hypothetical protein